jgi:hypothetical protein
MTGTPLSAHPLPQVFLNSHRPNGNGGIHYARDSDGSCARNDGTLRVVYGAIREFVSWPQTSRGRSQGARNNNRVDERWQMILLPSF